MNEKEVVQVLQHYRHDLMNELQILQGYLSMGKMDKAETKAKEWMEHFNQERKLMSLNAPLFILWVIRFNSRYDNFRLTYQIHTENVNLLSIENELVEQCNKIVEYFGNFSDKTELYDINLQLNEVENPSQIELRFFITVDGIKINLENMENNNEVNLNREKNGFIFKTSIPC